jgi:hypothetical protein
VEKQKVVDEITAYLREELAECARRPDAGAATQVGELERLLTMYRFLPVREYGAGEPAIPSSLVTLRHGSTEAWYFIAPQGGGLVMRVEGQPVQVITPNSPLGEALLGKRAGDRVRVQTRGGEREYVVVRVT